MRRSIEEIEDELHQLQGAYLEEEDEVKQLKIESRFSSLLQAATELDGIERLAANVTITNWTREE